MINQIRGYSNNGLSTFRNSNRAYYFSHVRRWQREGNKEQANPLVFGTAWHAAMDYVWSVYPPSDGGYDSRLGWNAFVDAWKDEGGQDPYTLDEQDMKDLGIYNPFNAQDMIHEYIYAREKFLSDKELLAIEKPFAVKLDIGDSNLYYTGRMDKVLKHGELIYPVDHKTTSKGTKGGHGIQQSWHDSWSPNTQIDGYLFACLQEYGRADKAYVDGALVHRHSHDVFPLIPVLRDRNALDYWLWQTRHTVDTIENHIKEVEKLRKNKRIYELPYMPAFPCHGCSGNCQWKQLCRSTTNPERDFPIDTPPPIGYVQRDDTQDILTELGLK